MRFRVPTQEQTGALIAMLAVLFGAWVRLIIPWMAGFPVNDGGLFYVMLRALLANGLKLPGYVQYNGLSIPFAYPPLGFYAGVLAADLFRVDLIKVLQWLPAIVLVGTLPAFYFLAKTLLGSSWTAGLATLMFAFTPRAITWEVMGGGLTRSFGQLFALLALAFVARTFMCYTRKYLLLAILFSSLLVLSHPEAALQTVGLALLLWLFKGRSRQGTLHALEIGAGTALLSSVWWLTVIIRYGLGTLLSAGQTGQYNPLFLLAPFGMNLADEPILTVVGVLGLIGLAAQAAKRQWLIPAWYATPFIVEPRSATAYSTFALALLAGIALGEVILPALARLEREATDAAALNPLTAGSVRLSLLLAALYMLGTLSLHGSQSAATRLSPGDQQAFNWIKANTPPGSRFLLLTGNSDEQLFCDAPLEWFPALAERVSVTTVQGREWQNGAEFGRMSQVTQQSAACMSAQTPLACLGSLRLPDNQPLAFAYIYLTRTSPILGGCRAIGMSPRGERLIDDLKASPAYGVVYDTDGVVIFQKR